ncbi:MAG: hypothetical protein ACI955_002265 [Zhongshania sp.]|jgi:hypothetical protein
MGNSYNNHYLSSAITSGANYAAIIVGHEAQLLALFTIHGGFLPPIPAKLSKIAKTTK